MSRNDNYSGCTTAPTLPSPAAGSLQRQNASKPSWFRGICTSMTLFLYRDFLPVLEGKDHLVVVDRDPAEQSADVALFEGDL